MEGDTRLISEVLLIAYWDVAECFGLSKRPTAERLQAEAIEDVFRYDESPIGKDANNGNSNR
jgi:hypothetical protein